MPWLQSGGGCQKAQAMRGMQIGPVVCSEIALRQPIKSQDQAKQPGEGAEQEWNQRFRNIPSGRGICGGVPIMEAAMRAWYR